MSRRAKAVVRTLVGLGLLAWLLGALDARAVVSSLRSADWRWILAGLAAQAAAKLVWAARWRRILEAAQVRRGFGELLGLVHMGLFFNSFLPTAIGGDLVRGHYTSGAEGRTGAYASLLVERAIGFVALVALTGAAAAVLALGESTIPRAVLLSIAVGAFVFTLAAIVGSRADLGAFAARRLAGRPGLAGRSAGPVAAASRLLAAGASSPAVVGWSLLLQGIAVGFYVACARAVGIDVPALDFFLIVPASVVASMLPVSLNGLGIREGVLVALTAARGAGIADAGGFALLALLLSTIFAVIGGALYAGGALTRIGGRRVSTGP